MPLFVWSMLVVALMIIFAMPAVVLASSMLLIDRLVGTHFFNPAEGGDALLWQHLFWFFGHPEVYIIFLPATGFIARSSRRSAAGRSFGYTAIVAFAVRHRPARLRPVGPPHVRDRPAAPRRSLLHRREHDRSSIPTGVQIFCWIATIWRGRLAFRTPMLFVLGFIVIFVIGGLTGVMLAAVPLDLQLHDTYFVVAHFHYVLIGGAVFPLFGAVYYWFPKLTGRMLIEALGKLSFWRHLRRLQRHLLPDAHHRPDGHAAARLHLPARAWAGARST